MKSLRESMLRLTESIFDDNITKGFEFSMGYVIDYINSKIDKCEKNGMDIEMDMDSKENYIINYWSKRLRVAPRVEEKLNIKLCIKYVNGVIYVTPFFVFGVDKTVELRTYKHVLHGPEALKGITVDVFKLDTAHPNDEKAVEFFANIDGLFEGFESINKSGKPVNPWNKANSKEDAINNLYEYLLKYFPKYPKFEVI